MGPRKFEDDFAYAEGQGPQSNVEPWQCSLFNLFPPMPGVMTKEEVERDIDLGHWKLELKGNLYPLNVSFYIGIP